MLEREGDTNGGSGIDRCQLLEKLMLNVSNLRLKWSKMVEKCINVWKMCKSLQQEGVIHGKPDCNKFLGGGVYRYTG